jgi:hypothetical protein
VEICKKFSRKCGVFFIIWRFPFPDAFGFCGPLAHIFKAAHVRDLKNVSSTQFFDAFILVVVLMK